MSSLPPKSTVAEDASRYLMEMAFVSLLTYCVSTILVCAYKIRMGAIEEYGPVIHEFDPYFNYRATEVRAFPWTEKLVDDPF